MDLSSPRLKLVDWSVWAPESCEGESSGLSLKDDDWFSALGTLKAVMESAGDVEKAEGPCYTREGFRTSLWFVFSFLSQLGENLFTAVRRESSAVGIRVFRS